MLKKRFDLLDDTTPLVFSDGTQVYKELAKTYKTHSQGYYILAPSGAGKAHFINSQKQMDWMDGDVLWMTTNAHPEGEWWLKPLTEIQQIERRSDIITTQAKALGFWIIGTDCYDIIPDAIVIPHWSTHKKYIRLRESGDYDGGATSAQLAGLLRARRWMAKFAKKGVPKFNSVAEGAAYLSSKN